MCFWGEIIRLSIKWHFKLNNKNLRRGIRFILCCCRVGAGASTGNSKFLLLKLLMFLQATKSIIPVQTCWKSNSKLLGDFNEGIHIDRMVIVLGFAATVKNVPDIFFSPESWIIFSGTCRVECSMLYFAENSIYICQMSLLQFLQEWP